MGCKGFNWWEIGGGWRAGDRARARGAGGPPRAPNPNPKPKLKLRRPARGKKKVGKNPATKGDAEGRQCDLTDGATALE